MFIKLGTVGADLITPVIYENTGSLGAAFGFAMGMASVGMVAACCLIGLDYWNDRVVRDQEAEQTNYSEIETKQED